MTSLAPRLPRPRPSEAAVRLADDLYFIAHDDRTGRPHLHSRAIRLGLAAALLGELMLADRIAVQGGRIYVRSQQLPSDALAHTILDRLLGQHPHSDLRVELSVIAGSAAEAVAHRLERAGQVRYVQTRRLARTTGRWVPTDSNWAAWRTVRLRRLLSSDDEPQARTRLTAIMAQLPGSVAELVAHTESAVGNAILAQRR